MSNWVDRLTFDILIDLFFGQKLNVKNPKERKLHMIPHSILQNIMFGYRVRRAMLLCSAVNFVLTLIDMFISHSLYTVIPQKKSIASQTRMLNSSLRNIIQHLSRSELLYMIVPTSSVKKIPSISINSKASLAINAVRKKSISSPDIAKKKTGYTNTPPLKYTTDFTTTQPQPQQPKHQSQTHV